MTIQTIYKTRDGKTHNSLIEAEDHELKLDNEFVINPDKPSNVYDDDEFDGIVEMSHEESFMLWKLSKDTKEYERGNAGCGVNVGNINNDKSMPVVVMFHRSWYKGKQILEWEATSRYVDYTLIDKYLDFHFAGIYRTNSSNIHNVR